MVKLQGLRQHYTSLNHSLETFRKLGIVPANDNKKEHKNMGHIAQTIASWLNTKQSQMGHTSDLTMIISTRILTIITREMGKLNTYSLGDTTPYIAWMINESIDLILDTLSTEYTRKHLRTPLESFTMCSMTMIMLTGPHIFIVALMYCKNWVLGAR